MNKFEPFHKPEGGNPMQPIAEHFIKEITEEENNEKKDVS